MLCPGCVSHGIPQVHRILSTFGDEVAVLGLHAVFEHHAAMAPVSLAAFLHEYRITFPVGVDAHDHPGGTPITMTRYRLRGTPSLVLIDRAGGIRLHGFGQVDDLTIGATLARLIDEPPPDRLRSRRGCIPTPEETSMATQLPTSPVSTADLDLLLSTLLWSNDDAAALARAGAVLEPQVDEILDLWYGYVGSHPHLVSSFNGADGTPSADYLDAVRIRFGQWIRDLCSRPWDQVWLDYQHEIARRHTDLVGATDGIESDQTHVPLRYMVAFIWPITATIRPFLANGAAEPADLDAMHTAWFKAVALSAALWVQPYDPGRW